MRPARLRPYLCRSPHLHAALLATAVVLLAQPLHALDPATPLTLFDHDSWQTEDGLPQNSVQAIVQTPDGYLWLATQDGLVRFDGVRFVVFDKQNTPELKHSQIRALLLARNGALWIGTSGGGVTRYENGRFTTFTTAEGLVDDDVRCLSESRDGSIWIGSFGGGVSRFKDGGMTNYTTKDGLAHGLILDFEEAADGVLWIGTGGGGVSKFHNGRFETMTTADGLSDNRIMAIKHLRDGTIWIGTYGGGLNRIAGGTVTTYNSKNSPVGDRIRTIYTDRDGQLWVGTTTGLLRYRAGTFALMTARSGLTNDDVLALHEDREGSLWIGTLKGGLNRLKPSKVSVYATHEGLSSNQVNTVYQDRSGAMWAGTIGGGVNRLHHGEVKVFGRGEGLSSDDVFSLLEDSRGGMWIGTDGGGLDRLSRDGRITTLRATNGLGSDQVTALIEDRRGTVWVGTSGGLTRLLPDRTLRTFTTADGLSSNSVSALAEDAEGAIWVGTHAAGLNRFHHGQVKRYDRETGLSSDYIRSIHIGSDGVMWVGTNGGGLNRFRNGRFDAVTTANGLFDDRMYSILDDGRGRFWMSSNRGIFAVEKRQLELAAGSPGRTVASVAYGTLDGMESAECNGGTQPAGWKSSDGRLWFPTNKGLAVVDPGHMPVNAVAPPVLIEEMIVQGRAVDHHRSVRLPAGSHSVEFHYTALSFVVPERVRFRYKLDGVDDAWTDAGARRVAYYTNVGHGRYTFRVAAANNDGVWNERGAALTFAVAPRFRETQTFWLLCAVAAVLALAAAHRLRVAKLASRSRELQQLVDKRTRELADAVATVQRQASLDGLTGIANRRSFDEAFELEWNRANIAQTPIAIILADIDFFKAFNDHYGHQQGDDCLRSVAEALRDAVHQPDGLVARYGGEEFVTILPGTDAQSAALIAEEMRSRVQDLGIVHAESPFGRVTISLGSAAVIPFPGAERRQLLGSADEALYEAKKLGRNRALSAQP